MTGLSFFKLIVVCGVVGWMSYAAWGRWGIIPYVPIAILCDAGLDRLIDDVREALNVSRKIGRVKRVRREGQ